MTVNLDPISQEEIDNRFEYHTPNEEQQKKYVALRLMGKIFAESVCRMVPSSREQSLALTKIEEAVMFANAGIARRS